MDLIMIKDVATMVAAMAVPEALMAGMVSPPASFKLGYYISLNL